MSYYICHTFSSPELHPLILSLTDKSCLMRSSRSQSLPALTEKRRLGNDIISTRRGTTLTPCGLFSFTNYDIQIAASGCCSFWPSCNSVSVECWHLLTRLKQAKARPFVATGKATVDVHVSRVLALVVTSEWVVAAQPLPQEARA
jgi:hypothetical protein